MALIRVPAGPRTYGLARMHSAPAHHIGRGDGDDSVKPNDRAIRRSGLWIAAVGLGCCCAFLLMENPVLIYSRLGAPGVSAGERAWLIASLYLPVALSGVVAAALGLFSKSLGGAPLPVLAAAAATFVAVVVSPVRWLIGTGAMVTCSAAAILAGMVAGALLGRCVSRWRAAAPGA